MQTSKKLYATLIITLLTISTLMAVIPMASAEIITVPDIYEKGTTTPITGGPVGTQVDVVGTTGNGAADPFSTVTVYWDALSGKVLGSVDADVNGEYSKTVTIPAGVYGTHYIVVNDGETESRGAAFNVTAVLYASTTPPTADTTYSAKVLPGDALKLSGHGFNASKAITVKLENATDVITLTSPTITTNATGSFEATVIIPNIAVADYGDWTVNATVATDNVYATADILVDFYITVFPPAGPTGITIVMSGRIAANSPYELRIDAVTIATGTSGADGSYSNTYTIPALIATGAHPITIVWGASITKSTSFTVTSPPSITLISPTHGVAGATVTISGQDFSGLANITLTIGTTTVNSTAADARFSHTDSSGDFTNLEFTVPAIAPGVYVLTVTDQFGASTGNLYTFTLDPTPTTTITLRGTTYYPGEALSFNIVTTETSLGTITVTIKDPSAVTWWTSATWSLTGAVMKSVVYQDQLFNANSAALPADAPLGTWNWTITYTPTSTGVATKATGLFTVVPLPTMQTVLDQLDALEATLTGVVTDSEGDLTALINTKTGTITTKLDALSPKLQGIEDMGIIIATDVGEIKVAIEDIDLGTMGVDITAIKGDVATIKTNIGTVTTNVASLDAKVVTLSGNVATVSTTLGTLEGTVTALDGKVATVNTSVGTVQADITDIKAKADVDMTPVWIAVVLSLIAAIAAIFAVVTIRQKIAG